MSTVPASATPPEHRPYRVVDLNYVSLYVHNFEAAVGFYSQVFGAPASINENRTIYGWKMGSTWLTVLLSTAGTEPGSNPRNAEFAVQVSAVEEVDLLHQALVEAGAKPFMSPQDTTMYEPMRFSCVDDPFGVRIDVYCPMAASQPGG